MVKLKLIIHFRVAINVKQIHQKHIYTYLNSTFKRQNNINDPKNSIISL